jgi:hypothetical protein
MNDRDQQINAALTYRLAALASELDRCSPELRRLILMACTGANAEIPVVGPREQMMARQRLNEAVTTRTKEAKAARRAVTLAAFQPRATRQEG